MAIYAKPTTDAANNEMVDHPSHYNQFKREVIEEMRLLFGDEAVRSFCKLNAYKYIRRADFKGQKEEDLKKAEWYIDYLDKMKSERIARLTAPKPEPIHVILDTYTKRDVDNIEGPDITMEDRSNACNIASVSSSFGIPVDNGGYTPV
jgi:hypothetical protein